MIYAIYKENLIPLLGGINPNNITIGLAEYNDWKLCVMEEEEFSQFSEFNLYPIPNNIAVGLMSMGKAAFTTFDEGMDDEMPEEIKRELIGDKEKELIKISKQYIDILELKFITRAKVRQFKDFEDDMVDTKIFLKFLLLYMNFDFGQKNNTLKQTNKMKIIFDKISNVNFDDYLNIKEINKIPKIINDERLMNNIVQSSYKNKLKGE